MQNEFLERNNGNSVLSLRIIGFQKREEKREEKL